MARVCRFLVAVVSVLLCSTTAGAQRPAVDPPLVGRPPDFSHIVGRYEIHATAEPTEVCIEEPIVLRVQIVGAGPVQYEPKREQLRILSESWARHFYVEEMHDENRVDRDKKTWTFVYRLKPKHRKIDAIDGIKLVTFDPNAPGKNKFPTRFAERIPITVKARPETATKIEVDSLQVAPESFFQIAALPLDDQSVRTFAITQWHVVGFLVGVPLVCVVGTLVWRKYHPLGGDRHQRQSSHAAEKAIAQLRSADASVRAILHVYFGARIDFTGAEPTPAEVSAALLRRGFARELCQQCATILRSCDAQRFGHAAAPDTLADDAIRLIAALEADRCMR